MTIQVVNDVVTLRHSFSPSEFKSSEVEEEDCLRFRKKSFSRDDGDTSSTVSLSSKDSDDDSVLSTTSSTITSASKVTFCDQLITMEWTRPYTEPKDISLLYYSTEETNRYVDLLLLLLPAFAYQ
jgi:hypothetical protein